MHGCTAAVEVLVVSNKELSIYSVKVPRATELKTSSLDKISTSQYYISVVNRLIICEVQMTPRRKSRYLGPF